MATRTIWYGIGHVHPCKCHVRSTSMCCDLAESVRSQIARWISFVFYCLENLSIGHNFGSTDSGGVCSKIYLSKWALQSNRKLKCHMFDFRLISLDHMTSVKKLQMISSLLTEVITNKVFQVLSKSGLTILQWFRCLLNIK